MLKRFEMIGVNGEKNPMATTVNLYLDPNGKDVDQKLIVL
jgi:hypothetical protein